MRWLTVSNFNATEVDLFKLTNTKTEYLLRKLLFAILLIKSTTYGRLNNTKKSAPFFDFSILILIYHLFIYNFKK